MSYGENAGRSLRVIIRANDPITQEGVTAYLKSRAQVTVLPVSQISRADVCVVLVADVTMATLAWIKKAALETTNPELRTVLVADEITEAQLINAINHGLVSFLPRRHAGMEQILSAVLGSRASQSYLPGALTRVLIEEIRIARRGGAALGCSPFGLSARETDVVRLLAQGWSSAEIASKLSYSERTIKNVIHGMLNRLQLRNRAHAVGHAARAGLL
ncbi:LuxR C-terminal-related transcriptional regulator [Streptomyces sp. NPDC056707]|uniref:helix-turn-helix transcriptional regulator n=1 Tax=Streptomyces sp. NPDC056707 TaxID=3345919 RepID=UPI0036B4FA52